MDNLLHLATCPIHLYYFDNPIVLACGHAYCKKCIIAWIKKSETNKYCPECRASITYSIDELNGLAASIAHKELVKMAKEFNSESSANKNQLKIKKKFKISFVGYQAAGKTSLMRCISGFPFIENVPPTIGVDLTTINYEINNEIVSLTIWDTAGQERFRSLIQNYYRKCNGIILVYDTTSLDSFLALETWVKDIRIDVAEEQMIVLLLGNKTDLSEEREVSREQAEKFANINNFLYYETSARTGENVREAFDILVSKLKNLDVETQSNIRVRSPSNRSATDNCQC